MSEEIRLLIENDLCMNKSKVQVIKLYLDLLDDDIKQKEALDKIKEILNNEMYPDIAKSKILELLEEIE